MWRWILVNLLILSYTSTQPLSDHDGQRECCPCPKPSDMATQATFTRSNFDDCPCRASVRFSNPEGRFTTLGDEDQALAGSARDGMFMRAGVVDDCPCRLRDADSVGAPSVFFPSAVRALWSGVSDKGTKDDAKPLLHPEVGLASSVLETLREATDEEYQEALARDAVKSVFHAPDVEAMSDVSSALDTARDIVNVLFKPSDMDTESRDDSNSEASNIHESRFIHPLGRTNGLNFKLSPDVVNAKPKTMPAALFNKKNVWDMDSSLGASNVNERVIDGIGKNKNKGTDEPIKINNFKPFDQNIFTRENDKSISHLNNIHMQINNSLSDLKLKLDNHLQSIKNDNADKLKNVLDSISSPSVPDLVLKPILPINKLDITTIKPYSLKSLLKLKDVELVPAVKTSGGDFNKARVNIPKLIPSSNHNNKDSTADLFKSFKTTNLGDLISNGLKISFRNMNAQGGTDNIQPIPKGIFKSGLFDAETSPSEVKTIINKGAKSSKDCDDNIDDQSLHNDMSVQLPKANTEIKEHAPNSEKIIINNLAQTSIECKNESENNNINNLSNTGNTIPKTDIFDTVPSPSEVQPIELINNGKDAEQEDFNNVSREQADCHTANTNEEDDGNVFNNSEENKLDNVNNDDFENDQNNIDQINDSEESDTKAKESEENCSGDTLNKPQSISAASNGLQNKVDADSEQIDALPSAATTSSNENCTEVYEHEPEIKPNSFLNKAKNIILPKLRKNSLRKLDKFKKLEIMEENTSENIDSQQKDEIPTETVHTDEKDNESSKSLEIQDLQNMSDKLLDLSTKKDQESSASENINCNMLHDRQKVKVPNTLDKLDGSSLEDDVTKHNSATESEEDSNSDDINKFTDITDNSEKKFVKQQSCTSNFDTKLNSDIKSHPKFEMTADGSEPFVDTIAPVRLNKPSLLPNIMHPKVQNIKDGFSRPNLKLPTLDEVRQNLDSILHPKDNFGFFNIKEERLNDDKNSMSAEASAPAFKSALPTFQPLEDIDLDIFQLRPLSLPGPQELFSTLPSLPQLNLNSYKVKLPLPKGLSLKPMKLESSLGGKNGLLGAALRVGSNKGSKLFNDPLGLSNMPTFEEFHSNLRENAQNLLQTPIDITGRNIIDDSLRSSQTLTDNIRSHAKNTVKDIQQTLETTLRDVKHSDLGILAEPLKDPKEFLQAVSRRHEDVTDKLKGIQYDLNDRLESIRDRITDQSLLPTLNTPMMRQSSLIFRPDKIKEQPMLSTSFRKPVKKIKTTSKSKPQSYSRVTSSRNKPVKGKTIKLSAAPSIQVPKTVEAPKLRKVATSSPPPLILKHPSLRIPQLLANKKYFTDMLQEPISQFRDSKIPVLGKIKPVNKVKISFGSTTIKPNLASGPSVPRKQIKLTSPSKNDAPRIGSKLRPSDSNGAPSIVTPTKLKAPVIMQEKKIENRPVTKSLPVLPKSKSIMNKSKQQDVDDKFTNGHAGIQFPSFDRSSLRSQGVTNSGLLGSSKNVDILSSLREAVKARLSNLTPLNNDKIVQPDLRSSDMLRSASENVESTNVGGLMRENASYTCKMMCTRNN